MVTLAIGPLVLLSLCSFPFSFSLFMSGILELPKTTPSALLLLTLGKLIHGFNDDLHAGESQIYVYSSGLYSELQPHKSNCLGDISTWCFTGISFSSFPKYYSLSTSTLSPHLLNANYGITFLLCKIAFIIHPQPHILPTT